VSRTQPRIGGRELSRIGLGCMQLSLGPAAGDEHRAIATIRAALEAGVTLLDTADAYAPGEHDIGHNERILARALQGWSARDDVVVATKAGHVRPGGGWELDGSPAHLRAACEASLRALEVEQLDVLQLHRPDPQVPFAESVGALSDLRDAGKIRHVGLSNVTVAQLEEAEAIVEIACVQNELSLRYLAPLGNGEVAACAQRGIPFLAFSPLGGRGAAVQAPAEPDPILPAVEAAAARHGVSTQRVTLAWLLALDPSIVPIPGSSRPETAADSAAATALRLAEAELAEISAALGRAHPAALTGNAASTSSAASSA
jgi:aryl-alcohol dehydrogenase-like predicted oxidoreductase